MSLDQTDSAEHRRSTDRGRFGVEKLQGAMIGAADLVSLLRAFENFQRDLKEQGTIQQVLSRTQAALAALNLFQASAVYVVETDDLDFKLATCEPESYRSAIAAIVEAEIDSGKFARALRQCAPVLIQSRLPEPTSACLFQPLRTYQRTLGMFCGWLKTERRPDQEVLFGLLPVLLGLGSEALSRVLQAADLRLRMQTAKEDLEQAMQSARQLARQVRDADEAKGQFLASMSHEIRTPMNAIIGVADLLLDSELSPQQRQYGETVQSAGNALLGLLDDILDFSKIEAGKLDLEQLPFDPRNTVEEAVDLLALKAYTKGLELIAFTPPRLPCVKGDAGRLRQILVNLLGNAIKFTEQGAVQARLSLQAETDQQATLYFAVSDTGIGVSAEKADRLFKPFSQLEASTARRYGGTGLGLAICKHLAEIMGGRIGVESQPGKGATFWFTVVLPKASPHEPQSEGGSADALRGCRVLVVEDNPTLRRGLCEQLRSWGCSPEEAATSQEALLKLQSALANESPFPVAILDQHLSENDGTTLSNQISSDPHTKTTALILLAPPFKSAEAPTVAEVSVAVRLTKPWKASTLRASLLQALQGGARPPGPAPLGVANAVESGREPLPALGRILLAEDNASNQLVALGILKKLNYRADAVANGKQVLAALATTPYDLILMDAQMPEMDGLEATVAIRRQERANGGHIPIIALTASTMAGDRERCLAVGMDDYLAKPVRPAELTRLLQRHLAPKPGRMPAVHEENVVASPPAGRAVLNRRDFLSRVMDDRKLAREVAAAFIAELPGQLTTLQTAVATQDCTEAARLAHRIKGAASAISADVLKHSMAEMESAGRRGDRAHLPQLLSRIQADAADLTKELRDLMDS